MPDPLPLITPSHGTSPAQPLVKQWMPQDSSGEGYGDPTRIRYRSSDQERWYQAAPTRDVDIRSGHPGACLMLPLRTLSETAGADETC